MNDKIVGEITYLDSNETQSFTDREAYLSKLKDTLNVRGINGWEYNTHATDVDTRYSVSRIICGAYGEEINKDEFYRLYEQHGAGMNLWGDSQQWIVTHNEEYIPDTPPAPTIAERAAAHRQVDNLVGLSSPKEFFDNVLKSETCAGSCSHDYLLLYAAQELTGKTVPELFPGKAKQGFFDAMRPDEMRQWLELGAFKQGQVFATKPDDLNRSKPQFVKYMEELYPRAVVELHAKIESMGKDDLNRLCTGMDSNTKKRQILVGNRTTTSVADRLAAAKEQCARQHHDVPAPKHEKGMGR